MADNPHFNRIATAFQKAVNHIHRNKGYKPEMLADGPVRELITATCDTLTEPLHNIGLRQEVPPELTAALDENIFLFSGFKTHHELVEASRMLKDDKGGFKPFNQFLKDVETINNTYNRNYLNAEYNFATASTQMAVKWKEWEADGDDYDLQYRTAGDDRVREEHAALDGVTLPPSDPFWNHYLPPNGWNCRCTTVQVRKGKYPQSNSEEAIARGQACTAKPKQQIFRFNPGKQEKVFPPKHPYYKCADKDIVSEKISQMQSGPLGDKEIKHIQQVRSTLDKINKEKKWFDHIIIEINTKPTKGNNGETDGAGTISLAPKHATNCVKALENIRMGKECTKAQETSMCTLWHELTHNRHKGSADAGNKNSDTRKYMELANEFVARNTLDQFFEALGGKLKHTELMKDRDNTVYNPWVKKYQKAIDDYGIDQTKVVKDVQEYLFTKDYKTQDIGLAEALMNNSDGKLTFKEANEIVGKCLEK
ncbi:MAG: minor capsid protein [Bacteroidales bacterium]|nr:minor capsid protein [Bacteroidales bacterium]